ncbi:coiled-coil domain-containing protein 124 [Tribolium madens]|uniref:coiled-coil domain-containing protein 124 n=1 Tax=Tribolium madens TaxID=41895 RepID=UPI001CF75192|nr:coiled-coil domain-containing protein 124 [Tribolium madens]
MPKKFATENTKAVAARERKKAAKDAEVAKKQQQLEEAYWKDDDKLIKKKQQRKEEQDRKREQQLAKKQEAKQLLEQEMSSIKKTGKPAPPPKVTRSQISDTLAKKETEKKEKIVTHLDEPLEENINRLKIEGDEARTVDEAIGILSSKPEDIDKHPERRMKSLYTAYETRRLEELKAENSTLRLSQLKQMIFKEWQKSPENPLNKQ